MKAIRLGNGLARAALAPELGGTLLYFDLFVNGGWQPVLRRAHEPKDAGECACYPMAPFCGRIRDGRFTFYGREIALPRNRADQAYPIHGQAWQAAWRVERQNANGAELAYLHEPKDWPWRYEVRQSVRLDGAALEMSLAIRNLSGAPMPAGIGFHPYFDKSAPVLLSTSAKEVWLTGGDLLPEKLVPATGEWALGPDKALDGFVCDHNFQHWSREAVIRWPSRRLAVGVTADPVFAHVVVYCPAGQPFFCVEPAGNVAYAVNFPPGPGAAMPVLAAGETAGGTMRIAAHSPV